MITFRNSNVLGSTNRFNVGNPTFTFENGCMDLAFTIPSSTLSYVYHQLGGGRTTSIYLQRQHEHDDSATYYGLPVIGFAAITLLERQREWRRVELRWELQPQSHAPREYGP